MAPAVNSQPNRAHAGTAPGATAAPSGRPSLSPTAELTESGFLPLKNYLPAPELAPPHFYRIEAEGQKVDNDYFNEILKAGNGKVFRFTSMPVPIFIERTNDPAYFDAALKGFENWEIRTNGAVRFALQGDPQQARIRLIFQRQGMGADANAPTDGGHTTMKWHQQGAGKGNRPDFSLPTFTTTAAGKAAIVDPQTIDINLDVLFAREAEVRPTILQNIVTHETGHALGLVGHSPYRSDMMFGQTDEFSRISERDLKTLSRLYSTKPDFAR
ncbi:MAG TPA: matrixin family metalloprotease [Chroococcales cyanobacterium]